MQHYNIISNGFIVDTILATSFGNACHLAHQRNYATGFIVRKA